MQLIVCIQREVQSNGMVVLPSDSSYSVTPYFFDVVVVGAGPGGSTAANALSRLGLKVAMVDRFSFPRDKACGDVIGPKARFLLAKTEVKVDAFVGIGDMDVVLPNDVRVHLPSAAGIDFDGVGGALPRYEFDNYLFEAALNSGVEFIKGRVSLPIPSHSRDPYTVVVDDGHGPKTLLATYLIGADGANSTVADKFNLIDREKVLLGFAVRRYVRGVVRTPTISILGKSGSLFPGYGWVFPSMEGRLNVGVGVGVLNDRSKGSIATKTIESYLAIVRNTLAIEFQEDLDGSKETQMGGWLKMGMAGTTAGKYRVLLVGDAAGLVNPLQGEGIAQAIESGLLVAQAIQRSPRDPASFYRRELLDFDSNFRKGSSFIHRTAIQYPKLSLAGVKALGALAQSHRVASAWGIYFNALNNSAGPIEGSLLARSGSSVLSVGEMITETFTALRG